ncbi:MAG: Hpt domain-containing protein, partial [Novosphingobium sp.]|nr:Hpt domain-containing protein [Novosphingobium sp.]
MTAEEIQAIFFAECEESLAAAESGLAACKAGTQDSDTVNAVFRAVHSIKGGAGAFGYVALQAFTHTFETLLSDVREGTVPLTEPLVDLLLRALDTLSDHVGAARGLGEVPDDVGLLAELTAAQAANAGAAPAPAPAPAAPEPVAAAPAALIVEAEDSSDPFDLDAMLDDITGAMEAPAPAPAPPAAPAWLLKVRPHAGAMRNGGEPLLLLRELAALGARCIECDCGAVPPLDTLDPGTGYLGWTFALDADVSEGSAREIFEFVGGDCGLATGSEAPMPAVRHAPPPAAPRASAAPAA